MRLSRLHGRGTTVLQRLSNGSITLAAVLSVDATSSASGSGKASSSAGEAVVSFGAPLSGLRTEAGRSGLGGARLAAEKIYLRGGLLGQRLVAIAMDDRSILAQKVCPMQVLVTGVRAASSFQGHAFALAIRDNEIETLFGTIPYGANGDRAAAWNWN